MAKTVGSTLEYSLERNQALMQEYRKYISSCKHISMRKFFTIVVECPCRRFWVSNIRAAVVVAGMMKGDDLSNMRATKREMFQEIFNRVVALKADYPKMSLFQLVSEVVAQPAPKFYLTPDSAKIMFYKARKEWYAKKKRRRQLC